VPALVSQVRQDYMPLEKLPLSRSRFALSGRYIRRFETATIRADERLYIDSWGLKASTTDGRFLMDITKELRVGPHVRFHIQGPADFWKRAYSATLTPGGFQLPTFWAGDRELGPLVSATVGGTVRYQLLPELLAVTLEAQGIYTQFLDHIYVFDRVGGFAAATIELEVE
jgi:hypothetical protein